MRGARADGGGTLRGAPVPPAPLPDSRQATRHAVSSFMASVSLRERAIGRTSALWVGVPRRGSGPQARVFRGCVEGRECSKSGSAVRAAADLAPLQRGICRQLTAAAL